MCSRQCLGQVRPFEMRIMDSYQNEVIHLNRPLNCGVCCFPCCLQVWFPAAFLLCFSSFFIIIIIILLFATVWVLTMTFPFHVHQRLKKMEVCAPPGNLIGTVEQEWSFLTPKFKIKDWNGETVLRIEGPCCNIALCGQSEFQVRHHHYLLLLLRLID